MSGPAAIPPGAVQAAAEAIERKLLTDPPAECMTWMDADEELARTALEAAEAAWPHGPPEAIPAAIRAQKTACPVELHDRFPKPSCWHCGRNGAFERAARIAAGTYQDLIRKEDS